jgi:putative two-component system response regulator
MFLSKSLNHNQELQDLVTRMAYVAEIKEWDNRTHLFRIRSYCQLLCLGMDIPKNESEIIAIASMLHDVGKITMSDSLLERKGDYKDRDWVDIEKHTMDGSNFLKGSPVLILQTAAVIAENHHERWDGSGYPNKKRGEEIPLAARICAIADVFDALTTPRPYKDMMGDEEALNLIVESSGTLFDPKVVKVFKNKFADIVKIKNSPGPISTQGK